MSESNHRRRARLEAKVCVKNMAIDPLIQLVNQIDEIDRFSNELKSKVANGETITVMDLERLISDAAARPLLQQEKEAIRAERNQLNAATEQ